MYFPHPMIRFEQLERALGENDATGAGYSEDHAFAEESFGGRHRRHVSKCLVGSQGTQLNGQGLKNFNRNLLRSRFILATSKLAAHYWAIQKIVKPDS